MKAAKTRGAQAFPPQPLKTGPSGVRVGAQPRSFGPRSCEGSMAGSLAHFLGEEAEAQRACDLLMIAHRVSGRTGTRTRASQATSPAGDRASPKRLGPPLAAQALGSWDQRYQISRLHHHCWAGLLSASVFPIRAMGRRMPQFEGCTFKQGPECESPIKLQVVITLLSIC